MGTVLGELGQSSSGCWKVGLLQMCMAREGQLRAEFIPQIVSFLGISSQPGISQSAPAPAPWQVPPPQVEQSAVAVPYRRGKWNNKATNSRISYFSADRVSKIPHPWDKALPYLEVEEELQLPW